MAIGSPEQAKILEALINTASQASAVLGLPIATTEGFVEAVNKFVSDHKDRIGDQPFLLVLTPVVSTGSQLSIATLVGNVQKGSPIIYVNQELRFDHAVAGEATVTQCSNLTEQENRLAILVMGGFGYHLLKGKVIREGSFTPGKTGPPVISKFHRPIEEFDAIIVEHLDTALMGGQTVLWSDRSKRILTSEPEGTEAIFQRSLFWWLQQYVSPKLKVIAEQSGFGQDKTDITVITQDGSRVIEVKWLGENNKGKKYDKKRIDEGLAQVKIYLDNDGTLVAGYLICYDGRSLAIHQKESGWSHSLCHTLCQPPKVLFLESEVPSVAAVKIARGATP